MNAARASSAMEMVGAVAAAAVAIHRAADSWNGSSRRVIVRYGEPALQPLLPLTPLSSSCNASAKSNPTASDVEDASTTTISLPSSGTRGSRTCSKALFRSARSKKSREVTHGQSWVRIFAFLRRGSD